MAHPPGLDASIGEPQSGPLAQENATNSSIGLARNPKPVLVPADEKQGDCRTEDFRTRPLWQFRWSAA
jgi:hypothetical protein